MNLELEGWSPSAIREKQPKTIRLTDDMLVLISAPHKATYAITLGELREYLAKAPETTE